MGFNFSLSSFMIALI